MQIYIKIILPQNVFVEICMESQNVFAGICMESQNVFWKICMESQNVEVWTHAWAALLNGSNLISY